METEYLLMTICLAICLPISFFIVGLICGHMFSIVDKTTLPLQYKHIIKPALQDCTHAEYYYLDSHRAFCDELGVNATK